MMKVSNYKIFSICLICIFCICCSSISSKARFGFKVGANHSWFSADQEDIFKSKNGFVGGVIASSQIRENIKFQIEGLYSIKGAEIDSQKIIIPPFNLTGLYAPHQINLKYIEIPITIKYMLFTQGKIQPFLYTGGSFSFRLVAELKEKAYDSINSVEVFNDETIDNIQLGEYAFVIGLGFEINSNISTFTVDARFTRAFSDVFKENRYIYQQEKLRNATFSLTFGVII